MVILYLNIILENKKSKKTISKIIAIDKKDITDPILKEAGWYKNFTK